MPLSCYPTARQWHIFNVKKGIFIVLQESEPRESFGIEVFGRYALKCSNIYRSYAVNECRQGIYMIEIEHGACRRKGARIPVVVAHKSLPDKLLFGRFYATRGQMTREYIRESMVDELHATLAVGRIATEGYRQHAAIAVKCSGGINGVDKSATLA